MKKGMVLEGGAMRGLWTAGVTDVFMEHGIEPDGLIGVSAGAAFGCNYKSRQAGRAIRYNMRFAKDRRFSGLWSLLSTGNYFNARFSYHTVPKHYDVFDDAAFTRNPMEFVVVCTDVRTGKPIYKRLTESTDETYEWIRASASMPLASRPVQIDGHLMLDGGVADSIPLAHFEASGYERNVVILTQPAGYRKTHNRLMPLMRLVLHKYPAMLRAMDERHLMYNRQLDYVAEAERAGRCLVIRPSAPIPIGHICHDPQRMRRAYEQGRQVGEQYFNKVKDFYQICE